MVFALADLDAPEAPKVRVPSKPHIAPLQGNTYLGKSAGVLVTFVATSSGKPKEGPSIIYIYIYVGRSYHLNRTY